MQKISMTWQKSLCSVNSNTNLGCYLALLTGRILKWLTAPFKCVNKFHQTSKAPFCENWCQGITNILNAQQYISRVYTTLRHHRNCPDRCWVTVPPHWHIWSLCTFSLFFQSVLNTIPNWTRPQISIERWMGSVCIISERAQSSGRCRGCPHCW